MSFDSGPITFRRFFVTGGLTSLNDDAMVKALADRAFGRQAKASPDGTEVGWVSPEHLFDTAIRADKVLFDRFAFAHMRIDRCAPPADVLRAHVREEELAALASTGKPTLTKQERHVAREAGIKRAQEEAKRGMFRRIGAVPVLMDRRGGVVYLGSLGSSAADTFLLLFRDTFGLSLEPAVPANLAFRIMDRAGDPQSIEDARPFHLVAPRDVQSDDNGFDFSDRTFLGREFLTWLWYKTDVEEGLFEVGRDSVAVMLIRLMHLDCDFRMTGSDTIRCDGPGAAPEARAALAIGKQPSRAGLVVSAPAGDFSMVFDGPRFAVSGLRVPDSTEPDRRGRLEERFKHVEDVSGLLDMLFGLFLGRRASSNWPKELNAMKRWALHATPGAAVKTSRSSTPAQTKKVPAEADPVILRLHGSEA